MLTLTQLSDLAKNIDIDLFEGLQLPEGSPLNRDVLINTIVMRCGLNYPNFADPYIMKSAIAVWSAKNQYTFEHIAKIYEADYSPIENYDRYEDLSTDHNRNMTDKTTSKSNGSKNVDNNNKVTNDLTQTDDLTRTDNLTAEHSGTDSTVDENKTSAYDSNEYQPDNKSTSDLTHGEKVTNTGTVKNGGTVKNTGSVTTKGDTSENTNSTGSNDKNVTENEKTTQKNHIRGNIGVVTATAMQVAEYELMGKFNPYDFIAGLFENDLTLFVY